MNAEHGGEKDLDFELCPNLFDKNGFFRLKMVIKYNSQQKVLRLSCVLLIVTIEPFN